MKKLTKALILLLSVVFLFTSCEGSLSSTLSKIMDPFSKNNLYLNSGLVKPNLGDAEKIDEIVSTTQPTKPVETTADGKLNLGESDSEVIQSVNSALGAILGEGVEIKTDNTSNSNAVNESLNTIAKILTSEEGGILDATDQTTIASTVNNALASEKQTEKFKQDMSNPAPAESTQATKNTFEVGAAVINIVKDTLKNEDGTASDSSIVSALDDLAKQITAKADPTAEITKGDVLQAQIITNIINTSAKVAVDSKKPDADMTLSNPAVKELVDGAILLINTSKTISGGIDLSGIDFGSIMQSGSSSSSKSVSRTTAEDDKYLADNPFETGYVNLKDFEVEGAEDKLVKVDETKYTLKIMDTDINNGILLNGYVDSKNTQESIDNLKTALSLYKSLMNIYFTNGDGVFNGELLAEKNQNFAFMLSGYKLLYSVADDNSEIKEYIEKANKAEISVVLDSAIGLAASEIPLMSDAYLGSPSGYIDYIAAIYENSGDFFKKDSKIVVNSSDEASCSKISIGQEAIKDLYDAGLIPVSVALIEKDKPVRYCNMWAKADKFDFKTILTTETQTRFLGHADFLDNLIKQMGLESLVYDKLEYNDKKAENLRDMLEMVFNDINGEAN